MNENQKVLKNALYEYMTEGHITHNKYREVLDVCLAALDEPAQASEPTQTGLTGKFKNLIQVKVKPKLGEYTPKMKLTDEEFNLTGGKLLVTPKAMNVEYLLNTDDIDKRLNEIADKVNAIYAAVNKLKEPVIKKDTRKTLDDYPLTKRQLDQIADHFKSKGIGLEELSRRIKNEIANDLKEQRIKGGFK